MAESTKGERLRVLQERSGLSYDKIAENAGYAGRSSVQRYFSPEWDGDLTRDKWEKLVRGFSGAIPAEEIWAIANLPMQNAQVIDLGEARQRMVADVPVYGTALGTLADFNGGAIEQTCLDQSEIIAYFRRPAALTGRKDVYAVYVQGSSMAPRFEDGEIAYVDGARPPRIGDDVLLFLREPDEHDGERVKVCLIKRLVRRTASYVELEQFNPGTVFKIPVERIKEVHRVIPWGEMLS